MILIEIEGDPENWVSHGGYGRRAFNRKGVKIEQLKWQVRAQYNQLAPICGPIRCEYIFHMPIPKSTSKIRKLQMLNGKIHHMVRPDVTNLLKLNEDVLKGIVFADDSQVVENIARKIYSERPRVIIKIEAING